MRTEEERELYFRMRSDPPVPPWIAFPGREPESIGWRMGDGETHLYRLHVFFTHCTAEEYEAYLAKYPEVPGWRGWYSGEGFVIGGARFTERGEERLALTLLSADGARLAVVGDRGDGLYRVRLFHRVLLGSDAIWEEIGGASLVASEAEGTRLAREFAG